jgi:predicted enzyme related to lactoylglutathione lyase
MGAPTPYLLVVLDTTDPERLARFWTEALRYERSPRSEEPYVVLVPPERERPAEGRFEFLLQRVPEPKVGKNRMHVDLRVPDLEPEVHRLERLGATPLGDEIREGGFRWVVMADPEGNEFCLGTEPFDR